jgi:flagellar biosynthesis/type III secretory pathway chaperone
MRNSVTLLITALNEKLDLLERLRNVLDEERRAVVAIDLPLLEETSREKERLSAEVARHEVRFRETVAGVAAETATPPGTKLPAMLERFQEDERQEAVPLVDTLLNLAEGVERRTRMNAELLNDSLGVVNNSLSFFERVFARFDTYNGSGKVGNGRSRARLVCREI